MDKELISHSIPSLFIILICVHTTTSSTQENLSIKSGFSTLKEIEHSYYIGGLFIQLFNTIQQKSASFLQKTQQAKT